MTNKTLDLPLLINRRGVGGDVLKLAGGTVLSQIIGVIAVPVLTHLYAPAFFGIAASFSSIVGILTVVSCLRYDLAILLPKNNVEAANVLGISLASTIITAFLCGLVFMIGGEKIAASLKTPELNKYLWLVAPMVLLGGVFQALSYWNSRARLYGRLALARTVQTVLVTGTQFLFGLFVVVSAGGLIGGTMIGTLVITVLLGFQIWKDDADLFKSSIHWKAITEGMKRYRKFPLVDFWGSLLNVMSQLLPVLLLGFYFSQITVGHYALASRVIYLPMTIIGGAIDQVFFQRAAEAYAKQEDIVGLTEDVFEKLVTLSLFPSLLLMVVGKKVFVLIFGPNWAEAGRYVEILSPWMFFWFVASPLTSLFAVTQRLESAFTVHLLLLITRVAPLVIGGVFGSVDLALILFSLSGIVAYAAVGIWSMALVSVHWRSLGMTLGKIGFRSIPAIAIVLILDLLLKSPDWLVILAAGIGFIEYAWHVLQTNPDIGGYVSSAFGSLGRRITSSGVEN